MFLFIFVVKNVISLIAVVIGFFVSRCVEAAVLASARFDAAAGVVADALGIPFLPG